MGARHAIAACVLFSMRLVTTGFVIEEGFLRERGGAQARRCATSARCSFASLAAPRQLPDRGAVRCAAATGADQQGALSSSPLGTAAAATPADADDDLVLYEYHGYQRQRITWQPQRPSSDRPGDAAARRRRRKMGGAARRRSDARARARDGDDDSATATRLTLVTEYEYDDDEEDVAAAGTATDTAHRVHRALSLPSLSRRTRRMLWDVTVRRPVHMLEQAFVPEGVTADYFAYTRWRCLQRFVSATTNVFGVQASAKRGRSRRRSTPRPPRPPRHPRRHPGDTPATPDAARAHTVRLVVALRAPPDSS